MRLTSFAGSPNCTLEAPGFGTSAVKVETVGYGMQVIQSEGVGRTSRTYYPFVRTSGAWYIEAVFSSVLERNAFHGWMLYYVIRASDQYAQPLLPITVTIPKVDFMKTGYISSDIGFGDAQGTGVYRSVVQFTSASDPLVITRIRDVYRPPTRDAAALQFYPAGVKNKELPPPSPEPVWSTPYVNPFDSPDAARVPPGLTADVRYEQRD